MAVSKLKLEINQGATFRRRLTWLTGSPATPVDLTGWTARMQIRSTVESAAVLHELTTENGGITLGGIAGTIDLYISATATAAFAWPSAAVYDLELVAPGVGGDVYRLVGGSVTLSREVTR
jgi:hypothetical protein